MTWVVEILKNFHFNSLILSKVYFVWAKKSTEALSFIKLKRDTKFREESTCRFKIDISNLTSFDLSTLKSQKFFALIGCFWAKYILFELKKYRGVIFHETEKGYKICRGIDLLFQKWHKEFDKSWPEHSKVSKIFTLMDSFWAKYILFELQKYRGVIFHDTEEICKFWRKTDLWFEKRLEKFGKFSPEHLKMTKLRIWWDPFVQNRKGMALKFAEE